MTRISNILMPFVVKKVQAKVVRTVNKLVHVPPKQSSSPKNRAKPKLPKMKFNKSEPFEFDNKVQMTAIGKTPLKKKIKL